MSLPLNNCTEKESREEGNISLESCRYCGRTFNPISLERHEKVCERTKKCNRRTVFNSFLQRAKEIGGATVSKDAVKIKPRIRKKEEHLQGDAKTSESSNSGLSPLKNVQSGYQQCPHCERCFSEKAADRHIAWCREQKIRLPKTPPNVEAIERLKARVTYQAPTPRRRESSGGSQRLVKSAESCLRDPSSPHPHRSSSHSSSCLPKLPSFKQRNKVQPHSPQRDSPHTKFMDSCEDYGDGYENKKTVKFKEMFPLHQMERTKSLDVLAALRLRLSELSTADDFLEEFIYKTESVPEPPSKCLPRFCYNCGTRYPMASAKYCCECGTKRWIPSEQTLFAP